MIIEWSGEAHESFHQAVYSIAGYTVEVTDESGEEYTAVVVDVDRSSEYVDAVILRLFDEMTREPQGEPFSRRVNKLLVV